MYHRKPCLEATADASSHAEIILNEPLTRKTMLFLLEQVLKGDPKVNRNISDPEGGDSISRAFFESLFIFADKDDKGELVVEDLETLFQAGDETAMKIDISFPTIPTITNFSPRRLAFCGIRDVL